MFEITTKCRVCGGDDRVEILSLGEMPLSDRLLSPEQLDRPESRYPLTLMYCRQCSLVQIRENVSPEILFCEDYPYYSSFSDAWVEHCRQNALELIETRALGETSLVVEIACNDGYMLRNFHHRGIPVLGIDPADPVEEAAKLGISVIRDFFTHDLAQRLRTEGRRADVILANNVLAHVPDLNGFVQGIHTVLKDDGVAVIEVPYVRDMIDKREFDTIYHEHHCYFSLTALSHLFARHQLSLNDARRLSTHGGSLRLFVERHKNISPAMESLLREERELGMDTVEYYQSFADRVQKVQHSLKAMLTELKSLGKTIAAYAAAAKGTILLNSCRIGRDHLDYVVDRNCHKQGKYMPGVHVPIHDPSRLLSETPDYVLLLAWNFKEEIFKQQEEYRNRGGQFIIPIPEPTIM